ncbi:MAG TPA: hypothetical protein VGO71_04990 [Baekduia sp.]|nr:hypothetical protein [Baekduia sp.]
MPINKQRTAVIASAVGLSLGGGAIASAASQSGSSTTPSTTTQTAPPAHPDEQALTGDTADKVKAAALAKLPGATILRVETDAGGVYEAHVRRADGTEAEVHVDKDYNVTSVDARPAGGAHGGHGRDGHHVDATALAKALGVTDAKLQAALDKVKPATGDRAAEEAPAKGERDTELAAALAKELGLDAAKVKTALDAQHPDHP